MLRGPLLPEWRWWPAIPFVALILIALYGVAISPAQNPPAAQQNQQADNRPVNKNTPIFLSLGTWIDGHREAVDAIGVFVTAIATVFIALYTIALVGTGRKADTHFRVVERAYIKMSHFPPGLEWIGIEAGKFRVVMRVKNFGSTPGEVLGTFLTHVVEIEPPSRLPYEGAHSTHEAEAFLVKDDEFRFMQEFQLTPEQYALYRNSKGVIFIAGYVEYRDRFGQRHFAGYARSYDRVRDVRGNYASEQDWAARNNLTFVGKAGFNFDAPLWDHPKRWWRKRS